MRKLIVLEMKRGENKVLWAEVSSQRPEKLVSKKKKSFFSDFFGTVKKFCPRESYSEGGENDEIWFS